MRDIKYLTSFNDSWGDVESNKNLKSSHLSKEVMIAEVENILSDVSLRFERSPNQSTTKLWAKDLVEAGFKPESIKNVCKSVHFKFVKHPSFAELSELLRPYLAKEASLVDELNDLQDRCFFHLRKRFVGLVGEDKFSLMCDYYSSKEPELKRFNKHFIEICVLGDWLRSYFKDGSAIMNQRVKTIEAIKNNDREYFIRPYKNYAKENNL